MHRDFCHFRIELLVDKDQEKLFGLDMRGGMEGKIDHLLGKRGEVKSHAQNQIDLVF
jgi:hypothetical protein